MSDFISILTHARRLNAAVKDLTVAELEQVSEKLQIVIEARRAQEAEKVAEMEKKAALRESLLKQMQEAGISIDELAGDSSAVTAKPKTKRPIKYKMIDSSGIEHTWTGIGRKPNVFASALAAGKKLEDFAI